MVFSLIAKIHLFILRAIDNYLFLNRQPSFWLIIVQPLRGKLTSESNFDVAFTIIGVTAWKWWIPLIHFHLPHDFIQNESGFESWWLRYRQKSFFLLYSIEKDLDLLVL